MNHDTQVYYDQFSFQVRYAQGYVVNIGANTDGAGFKSRGGVNVDLYLKDEHTGRDLPTDVVADARSLPWTEPTFDTAVLGEILEHMDTEDGIKALSEARRVLKPQGRVVITMPHDHRGTLDDPTKMYAPGIFAYHHRYISREELLSWVEQAGLKPLLVADIAYQWGEVGSGVVAVA